MYINYCNHGNKHTHKPINEAMLLNSALKLNVTIFVLSFPINVTGFLMFRLFEVIYCF